MEKPLPWQSLTAAVRHACTPGGLDLVEPFGVGAYNDAVEPALRLPDLDRRNPLGLVIGHTRGLWPCFIAAVNARPSLANDPDPLDRYVSEEVAWVLGHIAPRREVHWAHTRDAPIAIQRIAHFAGLAFLSPAHLSIHPQFGPWIALRAVVVVDVDGRPPVPPAADPCTGCQTRCVRLLAHALALGEEERPAQVSLTPNWQRWLAVRDACSVGRAYRYSDDEIQYHYTKDRAILARAMRASGSPSLPRRGSGGGRGAEEPPPNLGKEGEQKTRCALAVMARYPEPGRVKTRLAAVMGAERACDLYRAFLRDLDARFAAGPRTLVWMYDPPTAELAHVVSSGSRCLPQTGSDLGARMRDCFSRLLAEGFERVVMIGADVPHVRDEWLDEAAQALDDADLVLGPSRDGGYYLIAMRAPHDVFTGVCMGTPDVLAATRAKAHHAGLRVHLLPQSFDIDEPDDLQRLREALADPGIAAQLLHTAAVLRQLSVPPPW